MPPAADLRAWAERQHIEGLKRIAKQEEMPKAATSHKHEVIDWLMANCPEVLAESYTIAMSMLGHR